MIKVPRQGNTFTAQRATPNDSLVKTFRDGWAQKNAMYANQMQQAGGISPFWSRFGQMRQQWAAQPQGVQPQAGNTRSAIARMILGR